MKEIIDTQGITYPPVVRVEQEDDGSFTAVIDKRAVVTNAATRDANADKPREGAAIDTSPAPTLTKERINWLEKVLDIEDIDGNDLTQECKQLCDLARIGLQCVTAEPVAWRWKPYEAALWIYNPDTGWLEAQGNTVDKDPLIVKPEAK